MGAVQFGILGLVWVFLTVFGDFGFHRAGTRFLARSLGADAPGDPNRIAWITVRAQVVLGVAVGLLMAAGAGILVESVLQVAPEAREEARIAFLLLAAATPILTVGAAFRGFLEAAQRFGVLNLIRASASTLTYLLPAGAVLLGWGVIPVVLLLVGVRTLLMVGFWVAARDLLMAGPEHRGSEHPRLRAREILAFGGWTTVSTVVSPVLVYFDRFLLGHLVSVAAVGLYTAPFELAFRVLLVPGSIAAILFPAVSSVQAQGKRLVAASLARKAGVAILAVVGPVAAALLIFAGPILRTWLGPQATPEMVLALQILAPGILANSLAFVPFSVLQGLGRADVTGKLHLLELPLHIAVAWFCINRWSIVGAAGAWSVRTVLDAGLLFFAAHRLSAGSAT
jgi:O-antigen/teichoic acid export membrane protein